MLNKMLVPAFVAALIMAPLAQATPGSLAKQFSFSGTLFNSDGISPLLDTGVTLRLQVFNNAQTCVYYDETHTVNTSGTNGFFSVSVGGGTRTPSDDPGNLFDKIFHNTGFSSPAAANCAGGSTAMMNDVRYLRVTVTPTSGSPEVLSPDFKILPTHSALVAESLNGGLNSSNILKMNSAGSVLLTQGNVEAIFNTTEFPKLVALLDGSSTQYAKNAAGGGTNVVAVPGNPGSMSAGQIWYDTTTNQIKYHNGTSAQALSAAGSGIAALTAGTGLNVGAGPGGVITSTGTLNIDVGTSTGQIVQVASGNKLPIIDGSNLLSLDAAKITMGSLDTARLPVVPIDKGGTGVSTLPINSLLMGNATGTALASLTCAAGEFVSFNMSGPICAPPGGGTGDFRADGTVAMTGQIRAVTSSSSTPAYTFNLDTDTGMFSPVADTIAFSTGTSERLRIDPSGNVGIGTTTPSAKLHVSGGSIWADDIKVIGGVYGNSVPLKFGFNATEHMRIDSVGNIGIGTASPSTRLDVIGTVKMTSTAATALQVNSTGANYHGIAVNATGASASGVSATGYSGASALSGNSQGGKGVSGMTDTGVGGYFSASSSGHALVTGTGNVGIGTTNPTYLLHVNGTAGLASGTSWTNASDARLKDVHGDYEYGLSEIVQLHTVRYNYKKNNPLDLPSDVSKTGFIAQEVQKVIPEAVHERKDGYLEINVDPIHWAVVNAIKDLYHLFLDQSDEILELKKKNQELENRLQQIEQALSSK